MRQAGSAEYRKRAGGLGVVTSSFKSWPVAIGYDRLLNNAAESRFWPKCQVCGAPAGGLIYGVGVGGSRGVPFMVVMVCEEHQNETIGLAAWRHHSRRARPAERKARDGVLARARSTWRTLRDLLR